MFVDFFQRTTKKTSRPDEGRGQKEDGRRGGKKKVGRERTDANEEGKETEKGTRFWKCCRAWSTRYPNEERRENRKKNNDSKRRSLGNIEKWMIFVLLVMRSFRVADATPEKPWRREDKCRSMETDVSSNGWYEKEKPTARTWGLVK